MTNLCAACGVELPGPAPHHPCPAFDDFWAERPRVIPPVVTEARITPPTPGS
jgi:hypothetical protein